MIKRKPEYHIDSAEKGKFIIKNYNFSKPFTSFFPGIAGPKGSPLWCFYVNRGQCITSFGTENKDGSILEFQPANKAYALTTTTGFRTFLKIADSERIIYEPFSERDNYKFNISNEMSVSPHSLALKEINPILGLEINIEYFTLPGESLASLIRKINITNLNSKEITFELLDGIPNINPYGMKNENMKNMSRTSEAWSFVENIESKIPFYHVKTLIEDVSQVEFEERGNFFVSFYEKDNDITFLEPIFDPTLVFGNSPDLTFPYMFADDSFDVTGQQHYENRTPCAMAHDYFKILPGEKCEFISIVGNAPDIETLNSFISSSCSIEYINNKYDENKMMIMELMDTLLVSSNSKNFNNYTGQTFLDNILRGGFPLSIEHNEKKDVLYLYSRKHGDPERDYNDFLLKGTYLSYGNGNFRDIAQNRRNDLWYNINVDSSNVEYFSNLIQLDGHNPLVVQGVLYHLEDEKNNLHDSIDPTIKNDFKSLISKPFGIYDLAEFYRIHENKIGMEIEKFISPILLQSRKEEVAHHHEGFWIDHWFYIIDLIESYQAIFPDKINELLFHKKSFTFYDSAFYVSPRNKKYFKKNVTAHFQPVKSDHGPLTRAKRGFSKGLRPFTLFLLPKNELLQENNNLRQYNSVQFDKKKMLMIQSRNAENHKVRIKNGRGKIYCTSLFTKLFTLVLNKIASLDSHGIGIEMDSDKPGWNDSLNGLPGLFGSSTCETHELYRLIKLLLSFDYSNITIKLPIEIYSYYKKLSAILYSYNNNKIDDHACWDQATSAKENYRKKIHSGINGKEKSLNSEKVNKFLFEAGEKLLSGIKKSYNSEKGMYDTYYINEPENLSEKRKKKFSQKPLPFFLEGQMHAMLNEKKLEDCKKLYESVKSSNLYDKKLKMYKVNESLEDCSYEIGRARTFTPGWLENESIFLHMHYKYLLSLLRSGLYDNFFEEMKTGLVPFLNPETYGRSIFENSSFIASSSNPDDSLHGCGYISRLSGSTAEFIHMVLHMALGEQPFKLDDNKKLIFTPRPILPGWFFLDEKKTITRHHLNKIEQIELPQGSFAINFLGKTLIVYNNEKRKNTFGMNNVIIKNIVLTDFNNKSIEIPDDKVPAPYSYKLREGKYSKVEIKLK